MLNAVQATRGRRPASGCRCCRSSSSRSWRQPRPRPRRRRKGAGTARARAIGIGADVGLGGNVAQPVIGHGHRRSLPARGRHRGRGHAVQIVIDEALGNGLDAIGAREQIAERVELAGEVLDHAAGRTLQVDRGQVPGGGVVAARLGDAVAERVAGDVAARRRSPPASRRRRSRRS